MKRLLLSAPRVYLNLCVGLVGLLPLGIAADSPDAKAQSVPPVRSMPGSTARSPRMVYASLLGFWKGELTYRDYTSNKMVSLPTTLKVDMPSDAKALRLHYVYDDGPGKAVEETETVLLNPDESTYTVQSLEDKSSRTYAVSGLETFAEKGSGILVLLGTGEDDGKKADIRNTITRSGETLTMLHESRLPGEAYRFRNRFQFTQAVEPSEKATLLTAGQLEADFVVFEKAYRQLHPGLYRYNTQEQMAENFTVLQKQLQHDQTVSEAYLAFAVFLAKIKCGHSYPNFYNQPASIVKEVIVRQPRVPFYFRWIDRKMIVTRNLSGDPLLAPGTEVLSLNGVPAAEIQKRLLTVSRADGSNDAKRSSDMEVHGDSKYEAFDVYFPLLFPFQGDRLTAQIKPTPSASARVLSLPMMTHEQRMAVQKQDAAARATHEDTPAWEFRFLSDERAAYLRMPTWALYNSKWDWKGFLDSAFAQMAEKKTENLVIDLRGNEGGMSIGNHLLSKLIKSDLPLESFQRWVRYRKTPDDLSPYLDTWDASFKDWNKDIPASTDTATNGYFRMTRFDDGPGGEVIKAAEHPFLGHTYVLVDAANSSATFEFAQALQQNRLATLVGQPTGGNQRGINGGAFFFLNLPNSKIETDLPLVGLFPSTVRPTLSHLNKSTRPDAGLTPNILVTPRIEDIQAGIDTELTIVQKLIQASRKPNGTAKTNVAHRPER